MPSPDEGAVDFSGSILGVVGIGCGKSGDSAWIVFEREGFGSGKKDWVVFLGEAREGEEGKTDMILEAS